MKKSNSPNKFKIIWKQVFPEDAELRIQRAFEMLLSDDSNEISNNQLRTTIDRDSLRTDNKINEETINKIVKPPRSGREVESISADNFAISKSQKAQRKQIRRGKNCSLENSRRRS
jgi:hypothetical protein